MKTIIGPENMKNNYIQKAHKCMIPKQFAQNLKQFHKRSLENYPAFRARHYQFCKVFTITRYLTVLNHFPVYLENVLLEFQVHYSSPRQHC